MSSSFNRVPIILTEQERPNIEKVDKFLMQQVEASFPRLVSSSGEEIELPESVFHLLHQLVHDLAQGNTVMIVPGHRELTTQEAADLLNVSRQYLVEVLPSGEYLSESNAILNYLAHGTEFLSDTPLERAKILSWQFFEQYSHEPYIAVARFIAKYLGLPEERRQEYEAKQSGGNKALSVMERALSASPYLVGTSLTIADISLYAYTHVAHEGGFVLSDYPQVQAWLRRVAAHPKHLAMSSAAVSS